jgi:hypothetical protein
VCSLHPRHYGKRSCVCAHHVCAKSPRGNPHFCHDFLLKRVPILGNRTTRPVNHTAYWCCPDGRSCSRPRHAVTVSTTKLSSSQAIDIKRLGYIDARQRCLDGRGEHFGRTWSDARRRVPHMSVCAGPLSVRTLAADRFKIAQSPLSGSPAIIPRSR